MLVVVISPCSFKTNMTLNNVTLKRLAQSDILILICLNSTIDKCKFVPKCWFNYLTNVTTQKIKYLSVLMQLHLNPSVKGNQ